MNKTVILRIFRGHPGNQYWEEFEQEIVPFDNVIICLFNIQKNPINRQGKKVEPVVWEMGCLEEVCGSCSMLINGKPRQACTALIEDIIKKTGTNVIDIAPFTKFPLVRDLIVNRDKMFENLKKVHAWVPVDGAYDKGPGPKISPEKQEVMYNLANCMTCGCCVEACPQVNAHSKFIGPQVMTQVRLFNDHPISAMHKGYRLNQVMGEGGINDCGNAQNCHKVCPRKIDLIGTIATIFRDTTLQSMKDLFNLPDR